VPLQWNPLKQLLSKHTNRTVEGLS